MSIAAFYRNWVPFVTRYGYYSGGDFISVITQPYFIKGNIQPFKQGTMFTLDQFATSYKNYRTLYLRNAPDFPDLPPEATQVETFAYIEGNTQVGSAAGWYTVIASKDYTQAGRAPKHYQYDCLFVTTTPGETPIPPPVPMPDLVDAFEAVIRELHELTPIVIEELT